MSGWLTLLGLIAAAATAPAAAGTPAGAGTPGAAGSGGITRTVTIENMQFTPARVSVHRGERIVWVNKDLFPHTVTAANKAFDSGPIEAGKSWTYNADKAGEYAYSCTLHPTMNATLSVR